MSIYSIPKKTENYTPVQNKDSNYKIYKLNIVLVPTIL
jgi:hypothetical protein